MPPRVKKQYNDSSLIKSILEEAENSPSNQHFVYSDPALLQSKKRAALEEYDLPQETLEKYLQSLSYYVLCETDDDMIPSRYIRWIDASHPDSINLNRGAVLINKFHGQDGTTYFRCKLRFRSFIISKEGRTIFRKMTPDEMILFKIVKTLCGYNDEPSAVNTTNEILHSEDTEKPEVIYNSGIIRDDDDGEAHDDEEAYDDDECGDDAHDDPTD